MSALLTLGLEKGPVNREHESSELAEYLSSYFKLYRFGDAVAHAESHNKGWLAVTGYRIVAHQWCVAKPKATVVVVHGLFDHVGLYVELINNLLRQNVNVVAFDLPEHGLSSGVQGDLHSFSEYTLVLQALLACDQFLWRGPRFALGQSTGAAVILRQALSGRSDFLVLMALAPLVRTKAWWSIRIAEALFGSVLKSVPRRFTRCSHDSAFYRFLEVEDPLQARKISTAWLRAMFAWQKESIDSAASNTPILILQGTQDDTVDAAYNLAVLRQRFPDHHVRWIEGAKHHLVAELPDWRDEVFAEINIFIAACCAKN